MNYNVRIRTINFEYANKIYDVLVEECSAINGWDDHPMEERHSFCRYLAEDSYGYHEWRFGGLLGYGGKFKNSGHHWYVDCYSEDETPEHLVMIEKANKRLDVLFEEYVEKTIES